MVKCESRYSISFFGSRSLHLVLWTFVKIIKNRKISMLRIFWMCSKAFLDCRFVFVATMQRMSRVLLQRTFSTIYFCLNVITYTRVNSLSLFIVERSPILPVRYEESMRWISSIPGKNWQRKYLVYPE